MQVRKATYDKEAKALYIYIMPEEERKKVSHCNRGTEYDDPADGINFDWIQRRNKAYCETVGFEILNVELEDITNKADLPAVQEIFSK